MAAFSRAHSDCAPHLPGQLSAADSQAAGPSAPAPARELPQKRTREPSPAAGPCDALSDECSRSPAPSAGSMGATVTSEDNAAPTEGEAAAHGAADDLAARLRVDDYRDGRLEIVARACMESGDESEDDAAGTREARAAAVRDPVRQLDVPHRCEAPTSGSDAATRGSEQLLRRPRQVGGAAHPAPLCGAGAHADMSVGTRRVSGSAAGAASGAQSPIEDAPLPRSGAPDGPDGAGAAPAHLDAGFGEAPAVHAAEQGPAAGHLRGARHRCALFATAPIPSHCGAHRKHACKVGGMAALSLADALAHVDAAGWRPCRRAARERRRGRRRHCGRAEAHDTRCRAVRSPAAASPPVALRGPREQPVDAARDCVRSPGRRGAAQAAQHRRLVDLRPALQRAAPGQLHARQLGRV